MKLGMVVVVVAGVFAGVTLAAWGLGAANLGTAMGIGQLAFAGALVWLLLKR